jgi:hypothetical protein
MDKLVQQAWLSATKHVLGLLHLVSVRYAFAAFIQEERGGGPSV